MCETVSELLPHGDLDLDLDREDADEEDDDRERDDIEELRDDRDDE